jgi:hypothetical protein
MLQHHNSWCCPGLLVHVLLLCGGPLVVLSSNALPLLLQVLLTLCAILLQCLSLFAMAAVEGGPCAGCR